MQFEEKSEEEKPAPTAAESKGLFSALGVLGELNAALADSQTFLIDYHINSKAKEGWVVVAMTDKMILFRRDPQPPSP